MTFYLDVKGAKSPGQLSWEQFCHMFDLPLDAYGQTIQVPGSRAYYRLTGITPGRPKYPVNAENMQGKGFKLTAEQVKRSWADRRRELVEEKLVT